MRRQIFQSGLWMLLGNSVQQILQVATYILLARILDPSTFGYVALASVVIDVAAIIGVWGLVQICEQRRKPLSPFLVSHIFMFSLVLGLFLTIAVVGGVVFYNVYYGGGLVADLILLLSPALLLQAVRLAPEGILHYEMQYKWLALRNNAAALTGGFVAVILALAGYETYALAVQKLVAVFMLAVVVWIGAGKQIRLIPLSQYRRKVFLSIGKIGGQIVSVPLANIFSGRMLDAAIGGFLGATVLGQFKMTWRIYELVQQFTLEPLKAVCFSAFPKLVNQPDLLKNIYSEIMLICSVIVIPAYAGIAFTSAHWVPLVLGPQWTGAVSLFECMGFASLAIMATGIQSSLLLAYRQNSYILYQSIATTIAIPVLSLIGVRLGIQETIFFYLGFLYVLVAVNQLHISKLTGWSALGGLKIFVAPIVATIGMLLALKLADGVFADMDDYQKLLIQIPLGMAVYAALILIIKGRTLIALLLEFKQKIFNRKANVL